MWNRQGQQPQHPSPIKVAQFSSVPVRSVLSSPVSLPTSVRWQNALPCQKLDQSIQYICDQWNTSLPFLKDYEMHKKKKKEKKEREKDISDQCYTSLPSFKDYEMHCLNTQNIYVCPVCLGSFASKKLADKHLSQNCIWVYRTGCLGKDWSGKEAHRKWSCIPCTYLFSYLSLAKIICIQCSIQIDKKLGNAFLFLLWVQKYWMIYRTPKC